MHLHIFLCACQYIIVLNTLFQFAVGGPVYSVEYVVVEANCTDDACVPLNDTMAVSTQSTGLVFHKKNKIWKWENKKLFHDACQFWFFMVLNPINNNRRDPALVHPLQVTSDSSQIAWKTSRKEFSFLRKSIFIALVILWDDNDIYAYTHIYSNTLPYIAWMILHSIYEPDWNRHNFSELCDGTRQRMKGGFSTDQQYLFFPLSAHFWRRRF